MIRVYLIRHGIAAEPVPDVPDESRPLTAKGRRRFRGVAREKDGEAVALIGHDPQMSLLVAALAQLEHADGARVDFRKGAIVRIDVDALPPGRSEPRWNLKPRSRVIVEVLPLAKPNADRPSKARR